jgi:hypothetical protein
MIPENPSISVCFRFRKTKSTHAILQASRLVLLLAEIHHFSAKLGN